MLKVLVAVDVILLKSLEGEILQLKLIIATLLLLQVLFCIFESFYQFTVENQDRKLIGISPFRLISVHTQGYFLKYCR
jgi:hypothetical protein